VRIGRLGDGSFLAMLADDDVALVSGDHVLDRRSRGRAEGRLKSPSRVTRLFAGPLRGSLAATWGRMGVLLRCVACGAESDRLATDWRAYLAGELDEDESQSQLLMLCAECAWHEFGPHGWEGTH
jgi:hypothetical protein